MDASEPTVSGLARAILDAEPVDWRAVDSTANETERPLLEQLRLLATLVDFHREQRTSDEPARRAKTWGHLHVLEPIGSGAFGRVHRAWDTRLDREVALKLLPARSDTGDASASSIIEEGRLLARVRHPNVVTIYGAERIGDTIGLWMERIDGETLEQRLARGSALKASDAIEIGIQICHAVSAVHTAGLLHRDIKAQNVMLARNGRAVLMDFGTGRELGGASSSGSSLAGTPLYLAPELLRGGDATIQTDIYSLGVLLYRMVTGTYPVHARSLPDLRLAHERLERADDVDLQPDMPRRLGRIIRRAIDPRPERRYESADALGAALVTLAPRASVIPLKYAVLAAAMLVFIGLVLAEGPLRHYREPRSSQATQPTVRPVTRLPGRESQPALSPDGSQVAFVWEGAEQNNPDIYVKLIDTGEPLRLTTNAAPDLNPVWSPDGRYIAFTREGEAGGIYLIPVLGGAERKLGEIFPTYSRGTFPQFGGDTLSYSPDGKYLAVADKTSEREPFSIFLLAVETGEKRRLTSPPAASVGDDAPAFSPDGSTIAFARLVAGGKEIYLVPTAGGEPRQLTFEHTVRPGSFTDGLAWTPDGREIVFASNRSGSFHLWRVPVAGGAATRINVDTQNLSRPAISRHGNRLVWIETSFDTNIWRMGVPGPAGPHAAPTPLIASTAVDGGPRSSPDGERIVFGSNRSGTTEVWVSDREGRNPMPLTNMGGPHTGTPRWSPDGREIAFDSMVGSNRDIYVVSSNGGKPRRLTTEAGEDACPSWSRDGRWIYFGSSRSGSLQIWKIPPTGGPAVQVTTQGGFEGFESPDGRHFYYAKGREVAGLWRIPVDGGGESPVIDYHAAGFWRSWSVTEKGIYFVTAEVAARPVIEFFSFAAGDVTRVAVLERPIPPRLWGLAVSPDRRWILYTQIDQSSGDIMMMENFR